MYITGGSINEIIYTARPKSLIVLEMKKEKRGSQSWRFYHSGRSHRLPNISKGYDLDGT